MEESRKRIRKIHIVVVLVILIIIVSSGAGIYLYSKPKSQAVPPPLEDTDIQGLISRVGELIELPQGEEPTVASVADVEKLSNQPFFAHAQIGDRVLIYSTAKKAILYRPSVHKLIEVSPVVIDPNATGSATLQDATYRFILRNGTTRSNLTSMYIPELNSHLPNAIVVKRENASVTEYEKTFLSPVLKNKESDAQTMAKVLGIEYRQLPENEVSADDADFIIILGADKLSLLDITE